MAPTVEIPRTVTGEQPAVILHERTPVPLKWTAAALALGLSLGGGYALGQARSSVMQQQIEALQNDAKQRDEKLERVRESLADKDKRLALVEQAVVSLNEIAKELKARR